MWSLWGLRLVLPRTHICCCKSRSFTAVFCSFLLVLVHVWWWCCHEPFLNSIGHFWVTDHCRLPFGAAVYVLYVHPVKNPSRALVLPDGVERLQSHTSVKGEEKIGWRRKSLDWDSCHYNYPVRVIAFGSTLCTITEQKHTLIPACTWENCASRYRLVRDTDTILQVCSLLILDLCKLLSACFHNTLD